MRVFKIKFLIPAIILSLLSYWLYSSYLWYVTKYQLYKGKMFDEQIWKQWGKLQKSTTYPRNIISPRCGMYEDLAKNHIKRGMTVAEFTKLLGPPDLTCTSYDPVNVKCYIYYMGTCYYGDTIESGWLSVCVDMYDEKTVNVLLNNSAEGCRWF